jgi:7-carboxy-7-deazaguanine synthase
LLRITEIFHSLQGEANAVGWPTVFVRLTGCPLRCGYCDTAYAFHGGRSMESAEVLEQVTALGARRVCVTGGEPLAQPECLALLTDLCDAGYLVSLETGGAIDISGVDHRVTIVMDLKTPGSGEDRRNLWTNLGHLKASDQVKFVLCDRADYEWARATVQEHDLTRRASVLFSPVWESLEPAQLADWILEDGLPVRFQLQLHKVLWGEAPGR